MNAGGETIKINPHEARQVQSATYLNPSSNIRRSLRRHGYEDDAQTTDISQTAIEVVTEPILTYADVSRYSANHKRSSIDDQGMKRSGAARALQ